MQIATVLSHAMMPPIRADPMLLYFITTMPMLLLRLARLGVHVSNVAISE
jgi:hypothetical protein